MIQTIKHFSSFEELIQQIKDDKVTKDITSHRYSIRFILLDSFESFRRLVFELSSNLGVDVFDMENLLDGDDLWITSDTIENKILSFEKDTIVAPFSEIVRFYKHEQFNAFFHSLVIKNENDINCLKRRIYLPLIGIDMRFTEFINNISREIPPVWEYDEEDVKQIKITLIPHGFDIPEGYPCLRNLREWLQYWKQETGEAMLCASRPINLFYANSDPDKIFYLDKVQNAYQFLKRFFDHNLSVTYNPDEEKYWCKLLEDKQTLNIKQFNLKDFTFRILNIQRFNVKESFVKIWNQQPSDYHRWLMAKYFLTYKTLKFPYLSHVLNKIANYSVHEFAAHLLIDIFDFEDYTNVIDERQTYLSTLGNIAISPEYQKRLKENLLEYSKTDFTKAFIICGDRFDFERELLIEWYAEGKISKDRLKEKYHDAYSYLSKCLFDNIESDSWIYNYLDAYKDAKYKDEYTDDIKHLIEEKNYSEKEFFDWYNSFQQNDELISNINDVDEIYWIDALGIEWMSILKDVLEKEPSGLRIEKMNLGVANLPTSTDHNRKEDVVKIGDLDELAHSGYYYKYKNIVKELSCIKEIFNQICVQSKGRRILIVSDHGLTMLSRLTEPKKYATKASHEGRYILVSDTDPIPDTDYIRYKNGEEQYLISLRHNSLNSKAVREVHGGCTPEEVLVPFVILTNRETEMGINYHVTMCNKEMLDIASPVISLLIDEDIPTDIIPRIKYDDTIESLKFDQGCWTATLKHVKAGIVKFSVIINQFKKEFQVTLNSGFEEDDLF